MSQEGLTQFTLPVDILYVILQYANICDVISMCQTCKKWRHVINNYAWVWQHWCTILGKVALPWPDASKRLCLYMTLHWNPKITLGRILLRGNGVGSHCNLLYAMISCIAKVEFEAEPGDIVHQNGLIKERHVVSNEDCFILSTKSTVQRTEYVLIRQDLYTNEFLHEWNLEEVIQFYRYALNNSSKAEIRAMCTRKS